MFSFRPRAACAHEINSFLRGEHYYSPTCPPDAESSAQSGPEPCTLSPVSGGRAWPEPKHNTQRSSNDQSKGEEMGHVGRDGEDGKVTPKDPWWILVWTEPPLTKNRNPIFSHGLLCFSPLLFSHTQPGLCKAASLILQCPPPLPTHTHTMIGSPGPTLHCLPVSVISYKVKSDVLTKAMSPVLSSTSSRSPAPANFLLIHSALASCILLRHTQHRHTVFPQPPQGPPSHCHHC